MSISDDSGADDRMPRRAGLSEALFREVNERIEHLDERLGRMDAGSGAGVETIAIVCECADVTCAERIELDVATYERVRADPRLFVVVAGHEVPDAEATVEAADGFAVVRKRDGGAGAVAEATDPRS